MAEYEWDNSCADLELARLQAGFTGYDHMNFARVLIQGFARVEGDIHIETGRLRSSATARVDEAASYGWRGDIEVGGPGIRYAASEFFGYSPKHGGYPSHQFMKRVGWQPTPRSGLGEWSQHPIGNVPTNRGIEEDMLGPLSSFISRGRNTPHPEGPIR